jgi:hypothetical protein
MQAWQQYQRLKFEFKERSLPLDGSYTPPAPPSGYPSRVTATKTENGLYRSTSVPALQSDVNDHGAPRALGASGGGGKKPLARGMSGALNKPRVQSSADLRRHESTNVLLGSSGAAAPGWARASSPSIDLGNSPVSRKTNKKKNLEMLSFFFFFSVY